MTDDGYDPDLHGLDKADDEYWSAMECPHGCTKPLECLRYDQGHSIPHDCALSPQPKPSAVQRLKRIAAYGAGLYLSLCLFVMGIAAIAGGDTAAVATVMLVVIPFVICWLLFFAAVIFGAFCLIGWLST